MLDHLDNEKLIERATESPVATELETTLAERLRFAMDELDRMQQALEAMPPKGDTT
jgi:hypothetical protein